MLDLDDLRAIDRIDVEVFGGTPRRRRGAGRVARPGWTDDHALLALSRRRARSAPPATSWPARRCGSGVARWSREARHTGVYRALLDHRLRAGVAAGCRMALVKGRVETSAPVLLQGRLPAVRRGACLPPRPTTLNVLGEVWDRATVDPAGAGRRLRARHRGRGAGAGAGPGDLAAGPARRHRRPRGRPRAGRGARRPPARARSGCTPTPPGVTVSRGKPRGPGMVAMLAAGYLAPGGARPGRGAAARRRPQRRAALAAASCSPRR